MVPDRILTPHAFFSSQADKLQTLIKAAKVADVEPIWTSLFAKALEGKDVKDLLSNVGSGGGAAAAPAAGGAAAGGEVVLQVVGGAAVDLQLEAVLGQHADGGGRWQCGRPGHLECQGLTVVQGSCGAHRALLSADPAAELRAAMRGILSLDVTEAGA